VTKKQSEVKNPIIILGGGQKKKVLEVESFLAGDQKKSEVKNRIIILGGLHFLF
jgi:hypothetical protein